MKNNGKILFFSESEGKGVIITSQKEKIEFSALDWDDFDVMPHIGVEVEFDIKDIHAINITAKIVEKPSDAQAQEPQKTEETCQQTDEYVEPKEMTQIIESLDSKEKSQSIQASTNVSTAIARYFKSLQSDIRQRENYKNMEGELDYSLIKRFLYTTFNNLSDIDLHIVTPKIKALYDDLRYMSVVYEDFMEKTKYPSFAYYEIFLSTQANYMTIKKGTEYTIEKLKKLRSDEEKLNVKLEIKKKELAQNVGSPNYAMLQYELKSINGAFIDTVHLIAKLDELYKNDMKLLNDFRNDFKNSFNSEFLGESKFYKKDLTKIINTQAFMLDMYLWSEAKRSVAVRKHFENSPINEELNTKTYLKYYLSSLDSSKITEEAKKLFALYDYLLSIQKECIMIVAKNPQDAMEYEKSVKNMKLLLEAKAFIDEKSALKWAMKNSVKIVIIEDFLQNTTAQSFLQTFKKHVSLTPQIIIIGEKPKTIPYTINNILPKNPSSRMINDVIKAILETKK